MPVRAFPDQKGLEAVAEERNALYLVRPGYVVREVAGEFLLIPVTAQEDRPGQMAVMNETGKFLWEQLQEEKTMEQLLAAMTEEYEVSRGEARGDIEEFLTMLREHQLMAEKGGK